MTEKFLVSCTITRQRVLRGIAWDINNSCAVLTRRHNYGDSIARRYLITLVPFPAEERWRTREEPPRLYPASRPRRKRSRRIALERVSTARFEDLEADTSWNWIRVALERCSTCYFAISGQRDSHVTHAHTLAKALDWKVQRDRYRYTIIKERSLTISTQGIVHVDRSR